jgi:glycosyltransferase involved in cell wall biosynthesis
VIGARIGGIPEMIREGETGLLSLPGDAASLADALTAMAAKSAAERTAMGRAGRQWIAREFSASAYLDRTLALYRALGAV